MIFYLLRGIFILLVTAVAALYLIPNQQGAQLSFGQFTILLIDVLGVAGFVVGIDINYKRKRLSAFSGVFLGLIAGLITAYALFFVVDLIAILVPRPDNINEAAFTSFIEGIKVIVGLITCYIGISMVLQTKDDFRFIIPYVEFAKEIRGQRPTVLDTSVIIDGRIVDLLETYIMQGLLIVPRFVLDELQTIADSSDNLKRARGRRGLDILQQIQQTHVLDVHIDDTDTEGANVDQKLVSLCELRQGRLMTNDYNLNKVATLRGVEVINLNDLTKSLRPIVLSGEILTIKIVKAGEGPTQGIGYLDDGTMVVVEQARTHIGQELATTVTSTLQTSAGRMIFARAENTDTPAATPTRKPAATGTVESSRTTSGGSGGGRNPRRSR